MMSAPEPRIVDLWNDGIQRLTTGHHDGFWAMVEARNGEKQFDNKYAGSAWLPGNDGIGASVKTERIYETWMDAARALNALLEPHGWQVAKRNSAQAYDLTPTSASSPSTQSPRD